MPDPALNQKSQRISESITPEPGGAERRVAVRYPFTAMVELTDLRTQAHLLARTSDLCRTGCYVDTMNPLPSGSEVKLRLVHDDKVFETNTTVSHSQPGIGMGIRFAPADAEGNAILHDWLSELCGELAPVIEAPEVASAIQKFPRSERSILSQLVSLLIRKGILTEAEGASLLQELTS